MAKKDKNSLLNVHYSRTLTPDNLSKAANYVGEHVLKGLGTLGRFLNAGFTSPTYGTTGQVSYARNAEDAKRLRELSEASEQAMGKAMTWISPLNYGTALATGNGLNARKGEEEVASWSPAWQAVGRLGELYVGPKAAKGVKSAPRVVVNTAAKAGVKPAKTAVIAREIKLATKNKPNIEVPEPLVRTKVGDVEINNPELAYRQVGKGAIENFLKTGELFVPVKLTGNKLRDALNNMMGGTPMYKQGSLWYGLDQINYPELFTTIEPLAIGNKHANIVKSWIDPGKVIKKGIRTGEVDYAGKANLLGGRRVPFTEDLLNQSNVTSYKWVPRYGYKKVTQEPSTSLKFFERGPAKVSEAERFGLNKHDRKALSENEQLALLDLALYKNSGQYRQVFRVTPDWENFGWNLDRSNLSFMLLFIKDGEAMRGPWARVSLQTPTGKGVLAMNPDKNMVGYSSLSFSIPEGMNWAPGEANMMIDGINGHKIILTAPKTDFFDSMVEKGSEFVGEKLPNTIDKNIMKDFWINSRKAQRPGTYLSGDNGRAPKGSELIEAFKKKQLHKIDIKERPLSKLFVTRTGLSPDSYSSIIRQGNRDRSLRWGEGFNKWNNSAVENKFINEAFLKLLKGEITPEQYEEIFNNWSLSIGGHKLLWRDFNGHKIPIHPHPYIYAKKQGGKMNILEFLKNGSQTYKALNGTVLQLKSKYTPGGIKVNYNKKQGDSLNPLEQLDWYANWLDNRRPQLELNMKDTNLYPEQTTWLQLRDMRLHYQSGRITLNEEIYRQLNNASSSSYRYFDNENNHSGAYGMYLPNENNRVDIYSKTPNIKSTILHELTHSANRPNIDENGYYTGDSATSPLEKKILQLGITTDKDLYKMLLKLQPENSKDIINLDYYLSVPSEIYARMMEFRKENNLNPKKNYTEKEIRDLMLKSKVEGINYYKPEDFTKLLNEVAYNDTANLDIYYAKNGSKIHIKKKNRGKFTSYCGGKVTDECIRKAKASGNPTLVKRATFADNARHFKHRLGGSIVEAFKLRRLILNSLNNMIND